MIGWLIALTLAGLTLVFLRLPEKRSREAFEIVLVAVIVALAGYAWQGSPGMAGSPVQAATLSTD